MILDKQYLGFASVIISCLLAIGTAYSAGKYDPGASDTEIKIGNTAPYSGAGSAYSAFSKAATAYFKMINDKGGVNGRKITFLTYDDNYSPPKAVEQTRRLIEQDQVLFLFQTVGTAANTVIWKYMNDKQIPQLFVAAGAAKFGDPVEHPWTMGWQPNFQSEAKIYARYILKNLLNARIGILYQNDDYGKDYVKGLKEGLGDKAKEMIVSEQSYEVTDPTIDSQVVNLKNSGADVLFEATGVKFAAQAIRKVTDIGWKPTHILSNPATSIGAVLKPAGLEASKGLISAFYLKDPNDPRWKDDPGVKEWLTWMEKYYPDGNNQDILNVWGYSMAETLVHVLKQAGEDLTRANIMKQAANIKDLELPTLLPGIKINTSPTDFYPIEQMQLAQFDGERWVLFGDIIDVSAKHVQ